MQLKRLVIFGAEGHAHSVFDVASAYNKWESYTFISPRPPEFPEKLPVDFSKTYIPEETDELIVGIGNNAIRKRVYFEENEKSFVSIISKLAYTSPSAKVGLGCFIGNYCHIGPNASIGKNCIINTSSIIEHDVKISSHTHIAPGSVIAGNVKIGEEVFVGAGAVVINNLSICDKVVIGAGSTVVNDIIEPGTYVGTPAKKIK